MTKYQITAFDSYYEEMGEDGPYTAKQYCISAESPAGHNFVLTGYSTKNEEEAFEMADKISRHMEANPDWSPEDNEHWHYWRTTYGSGAWSKADEHEQQKADVEAEYGPGSYQPNHPGYLK